MPTITPTQIAIGVSVIAGGATALILFVLVVFGGVLAVKWLRSRKAAGKSALPALPAMPAQLAPGHVAVSGLLAGLNHIIGSHTAGLSGSGIASALLGIGEHLAAWEKSRNHAEMKSLLAHYGMSPSGVALVDKVVGTIEDKAGIAPETPPAIANAGLDLLDKQLGITSQEPPELSLAKHQLAVSFWQQHIAARDAATAAKP